MHEVYFVEHHTSWGKKHNSPLRKLQKDWEQEKRAEASGMPLIDRAKLKYGGCFGLRTEPFHLVLNIFNLVMPKKSHCCVPLCFNNFCNIMSCNTIGYRKMKKYGSNTDS